MNRLKLAVIGLGFGKRHANLIHSESFEADLAAVSDINPDFSAFAAKLGVPFYTDYAEMIRREKPDAVVVAVPAHYHAAVGAACMEHGVHVLMEKPIANTLADADSLIESAKRNGVHLEIGHMYRFDKGVELAKQKLANKEIGQLAGFHIFSTYLKSPSYFNQEWRTKRDIGGGPLLTNCIHDLDRLRYVSGELETVSALMSNAVRQFEVEDTIAVSIKCTNGAVGTIFLSDCSHRAEPFTDYYFGTKASMMFNSSSFYVDDPRHLFQQVSWDYGKNQRIEQTVLEKENNHLKLLLHFCRVIQGKADPRTTGKDGRKTLQALLAIQEAMLTQRVVTI